MKAIPPILLASQSPRRKSILEMAGYDFRVKVVPTDETGPEHLSVYELIEHIALKKAEAVLEERKPQELIVTADTIVLLDNEILGKPKDQDQARAYLKRLSGSIHEVITSVCLHNGERSLTFSETTQVHFKALSPDIIEKYVASDEPYDKAGAYAIQGFIGMRGIQKIDGCYFNVMGLPVSRLSDELEKFCF